MISDQNCTARGSITTLLHPFFNCPNTGLVQFKYFIDAVLSQFQIKLIHFGWGRGGGGDESFGNNSCKICHMILCFSFSCNLIGYFKQALKSGQLFFFFLVQPPHWLGKRCNQITETTSDFRMSVITQFIINCYFLTISFLDK